MGTQFHYNFWGPSSPGYLIRTAPESSAVPLAMKALPFPDALAPAQPLGLEGQKKDEGRAGTRPYALPAIYSTPSLSPPLLLDFCF